MTTLLICGPREIKDVGWVERNVFAFLDAHPEITRMVHGVAVGVDVLSDKAVRKYNWLQNRQIKIIRKKPDYDTYGNSAPFTRNQDMVDIADVTLALHDGTDGGTADSIKKSRKKGILTITVLYPEIYDSINKINEWF